MVYGPEFLYTPIVLIATLVLSLFAMSIVLGKLSGNGFDSTKKAGRILYISDASYAAILNADISWSNKTVYISSDKVNLGSNLEIILPDARSIPDGTIITIFNSITGPGKKDIKISYTGEKFRDVGYTIPSYCSFAQEGPARVGVTLGHGQGVSLINQARFGNRYIVTNAYNPAQDNVNAPSCQTLTPSPGDFLPPDLDPKDWVIWKYWNDLSAQTSLFCNVPFNNVGTTGANKFYNSTTAANPNNLVEAASGCVGAEANGGYFGAGPDNGKPNITGGDPNVYPPTQCVSYLCACATSGSLWCNTTL